MVGSQPYSSSSSSSSSSSWCGLSFATSEDSFGSRISASLNQRSALSRVKFGQMCRPWSTTQGAILSTSPHDCVMFSNSLKWKSLMCYEVPACMTQSYASDSCYFASAEGLVATAFGTRNRQKRSSKGPEKMRQRCHFYI